MYLLNQNNNEREACGLVGASDSLCLCNKWYKICDEYFEQVLLSGLRRTRPKIPDCNAKLSHTCKDKVTTKLVTTYHCLSSLEPSLLKVRNGSSIDIFNKAPQSCIRYLSEAFADAGAYN